MSEPFRNAPDLGQQFDQTQDMAREDRDPDSAERERIETLDELNHDPPEKVFDHERVMAPTPFGTIDVDVQQELDSAAQRAIHEAQQQDRDVDHDFADLRSIDDMPGAGVEYETHVREQDDYETRMRNRFNHAHERDLDFDR